MYNRGGTAIGKYLIERITELKVKHHQIVFFFFISFCLLYKNRLLIN